MISGITGQDGSYLADMYLKQGHTVIGLKRRSSTDNESRLLFAREFKKFNIVEVDITDAAAVTGVISQNQPDIFINTAAQSHVATSFANPAATFEVNTVGVINCLEAIKNFSPVTRFIQCGTSEQFGSNYNVLNGRKVQNENTQFIPQSPYAVSKVAAFELVRLYRDAYNIFASNAISFNHGGPRRGDNFIEMKVGKWIRDNRKFISGDNSFASTYFLNSGREIPKLRLGNLKSWRDFTDARDIVVGLDKIANHDVPDDFVLCSENSIQMWELVASMFNIIGVNNWSDYVYIDKELFRPAEVDYLCGDATKAREILNWRPQISLDKMCRDIIYK